MNKIITRFAPSPTGKLHIGNIRTALFNWCYTRQKGGQFILRIDDTDTTRNSMKYKDSILEDLTWLGLKWDTQFNQLSRLMQYEQAKHTLITKGLLYPCYETTEELNIKRESQLSRGLPPIYDRTSLKLTNTKIRYYKSQGRKPHYRFFIKDQIIQWQDIIKGEMQYQGNKLSDPILIRTDGTITYMLCSIIDDIEYQVSHVIRGDDHINNTPIQIQILKALNAKIPVFGHIGLIKSKDNKISKRIGGFEITRLRHVHHIEPMAVNNFLTLIGSSNDIYPYKTIEELTKNFDISKYSKNSHTYMLEDLKLLNRKIISKYDYVDIMQYLKVNNLKGLDKEFWLAIRPNISTLSDIKDYWESYFNFNPKQQISNIADKALLSIAAQYLPEVITNSTWEKWINYIKIYTGKKGKALFMPLRLALTGKVSGPKLKDLLPLLPREEIIARLTR